MQKFKVSGQLINKANKKNIFHFKVWYERLFVMTPNTLTIFKNNKNGNISTQIPQADLFHIDSLSKEHEKTSCPFKFWFTLHTKARKFELYAPTREEREIWLKSFARLLQVKTKNADTDYADVSDDDDLQVRYMKMQQDEIDEKLKRN